MSKATEQQANAIKAKGTNVIVSAGAGSGKTFVLKERVLKTVESGISVDKLIILTFTKNAASEMKERIRKIIGEHPELANESAKVDSAYICTFDSYSSSLEKKYNYLLDMPKNFAIVDDNIIEIELNKIVDNIFDKYYLNKDSNFIELLNNHTYKSDKDIKKSIIELYKKTNNFLNKKEYLESYINNFYSDKYIDNKLDEYNNLVFAKFNEVLPLYEDLIDLSETEKVITTNTTIYNDAQNVSTIEELNDVLNQKLAVVAKNEEYQAARKKITDKAKEIKDLTKYSLNELKEQYISTKPCAEIIIQILSEIDLEINNFKKVHNSYEFNDIALKAIDLVKEHEDVRNEIRDSIYEIMIDEYQDTSDIQETFISYIQNNNVYMVGDVKQSIYRFRNANPYIFKNKYDSYEKYDEEKSDDKSYLEKIKGFRIDLTKNFRSRGEVINNINDFFSYIMSDNVGGANYEKDHKMEHGNTSYDANAMDNFDYNVRLLNYTLTDKKYKASDVEAHIIAKDIIKHMNSNEYAFHEVNGENTLVPLTYSDFAILVDVSTNFDLLKKTLEEYNIPSIIEKDVSLKEDEEIYILKNLITLLIHIKNNNFDTEFRHSYLSIARSYIWEETDEELFNLFVYNKDIKEEKLFQKLLKISKLIDSKSNKEIILTLINEFDIVNKLININNVSNRLMRLEYFINEADSLNKFGMDIYELNEYFNNILTGDEDIKARGKSVTSNAVTIMTIHGSKGLEYNYVYLPYLNSSFINSKDNPKYNINEKYGLIIPYYDDVLDNTFIYKLNENNNKIETISEKIRLLYVAITRAKEQFIMIQETNDKIEVINDFNDDIMLKCKSFSDIVSYLGNYFNKYKEEIDINDLDLEKNENITTYNYQNKIEMVPIKIETKQINLKNELIESNHFSKSITKLIDKEMNDKLKLGTYLHYLFEIYDFKGTNNIKDENIIYIENFLKHEEVKNIKNSTIYKEYEFEYIKENETLNGIIDLLLEYEDHFDIIDYKTSNTDSPEYIKQLNGYKDYIENTYNKKANIYLYSIFKDEFKKI